LPAGVGYPPFIPIIPNFPRSIGILQVNRENQAVVQAYLLPGMSIALQKKSGGIQS
jgi:hypothetical protein